MAAPLIKNASIAENGSTYQLSFELDGKTPNEGTYLVGLYAHSHDKARSRQLGIKYLNGELIAFYTFDFRSPVNHGNTSRSAHVGGTGGRRISR